MNKRSKSRSKPVREAIKLRDRKKKTSSNEENKMVECVTDVQVIAKEKVVPVVDKEKMVSVVDNEKVIHVVEKENVVLVSEKEKQNFRRAPVKSKPKK